MSATRLNFSEAELPGAKAFYRPAGEASWEDLPRVQHRPRDASSLNCSFNSGLNNFRVSIIRPRLPAVPFPHCLNRSQCSNRRDNSNVWR